ncbi:MAG: DUF456 domain-containing protein, partial [Thermus sp.]
GMAGGILGKVVLHLAMGLLVLRSIF